MELAIKTEIYRQIDAYLDHPALPISDVIPQATYRWDPKKRKQSS